MLGVTAEVAKMGKASVTLALVERDRMRPARFPAELAQELEQALK
jgi:acyl-CoA thioesterase FadM